MSLAFVQILQQFIWEVRRILNTTLANFFVKSKYCSKNCQFFREIEIMFRKKLPFFSWNQNIVYLKVMRFGIWAPGYDPKIDLNGENPKEIFIWNIIHLLLTMFSGKLQLSLLDNAPNYLVEFVIQKRYIEFIIII